MSSLFVKKESEKYDRAIDKAICKNSKDTKDAKVRLLMVIWLESLAFCAMYCCLLENI